MSKKEEYLLSKIADLEQQLVDRNNELAVFRGELNKTNEKLSLLLSKLKNELKYSQELQRYLIPTEFPSIPSFEFSSKYIAGEKEGGDYFDIFPHDDKSKFGILMASCSGYMLSALLMSTLLKISSLMETKKNPNPNQAVKAILADLQKNMGPEQNVDLMYSVFDRKKFELNYVCMGDMIAVVQRASDQKIIPFEEKMPAITTEFDGDLKVGHSQINPNDRLVFATKGCYLVQGHDHEQYGKARFLQSIVNAPSRGVHKLRNKICFDIDSYQNSERPDRDMTVVIAEVKDRVIKLA